MKYIFIFSFIQVPLGIIHKHRKTNSIDLILNLQTFNHFNSTASKFRIFAFTKSCRADAKREGAS